MTQPTPAEVIDSHSPQDPDVRIVRVPALSESDVQAAAVRSRQAQGEWWANGAAARSSALATFARVLGERRDEVRTLIVREVGKPVTEADAEVSRAVSIAAYYAQRSYGPTGETFPPSTGGLLFTERRPRGVAGIVTPWNFPVAIPLWKSLPALVAGNSVLLKPSPDATATALLLAELAADCFPDDLLQVLPGGPATGAAILAASDVVSFTGSDRVGREVSAGAAARGIPVQAEMGGHSAAIVLPDADAAVAAGQIAPAAMAYAGQKCTATRRIVVVGDDTRRHEVYEALRAAVAALELGNPADAGVSVGPMISEAARAKAMRVIGSAEDAGARVLAGGRAPDRSGWYLEPTLLDNVPDNHTLAREELFAPVAALVGVDDVDAAVVVAESTRYGLVTSIHGRDFGALLDVARRVSSGMVKVNAPTTGVDFYAPFGGEGDSSHGPREQGEGATDFFSAVHTVTFAPHP